MIYLLALLPATALTIAGYFVLYLAARAEGSALRNFGRYLAFWAFTLAGLVMLGALFAAAHGHRGPHPGMWGMRGDMRCPWPQPPPLPPRAGPGEAGPPAVPPGAAPADGAGSPPR